MIRVGSDFSGVGAFDQALIRLGIEYQTVFACDWDKFARQTYIHNYGEPKYFPKDVYDRAIPSDPLDIYMTSPPCQAFSLAGKRKGEDDKRGILFYNSHEFIEKNKPRYFIFENVKGLLSDDSGKTFRRWVEYLGGKSINGNPVIFPHPESVPYHIYYKVLNAKDYNIPQNRERVFIIGIRDDEDNNFTWPKELFLEKRLKDVLEADVDEKYYLSEKMIAGFISHAERQKQKGNGFTFEPTKGDGISKTVTTGEGTRGYTNFIIDPICVAMRGRNPDNPSQRIAGQKNVQTLEPNSQGTTNTISTVQKDNLILEPTILSTNLSGQVFENDYCGTLRANASSNYQLVKTPYRIRRLTPRECFRLMDFPDTFTWPVSDSQAYKQAGNSICVGVLAAIIEKLNIKK